MSAKKSLSSPNIKNDNFFRNRSASLNVTPVKEFHYTEVTKTGGQTLARSISCGLFYSQKKGGQLFEASCVKVSKYISPNKSAQKSLPAIEYKKPEVKKSKKSLNFNKKQKFNFSKKWWSILAVPIFLSAAYYMWQPVCEENWDTRELHADLKSLVYGQDKVLSKLDEVFSNEIVDIKEPLLLVFTGSIGVGKTYISSIIHRNFGWQNNVITLSKYIYPVDYKLSSCGLNLVIIDNYALKDVITTIKLVRQIISDAQHYEKKVIIILMFTTKTDTAHLQLLDIFKQANLYPEIVTFRNLDKEDFVKCFQYEFSRNELEVSQQVIEDMVSEKMNKDENIGCKGVIDQVLYYNGQVR